jgi:hypothetical protein
VFAVSKLAKVANVFLTVEWNNWMYGGEGDYYCCCSLLAALLLAHCC